MWRNLNPNPRPRIWIEQCGAGMTEMKLARRVKQFSLTSIPPRERRRQAAHCVPLPRSAAVDR